MKRTHNPLCIFICPYVPSIHQLTHCSPFLPLPHSLPHSFVCQQTSSPPTPPQFILSSPFLPPPHCTASLHAPPLHLRWIEWTLCSKINFEMNEAIAVCACSLILCQKNGVKVMSWAIYYQDTPLPHVMLRYPKTNDSHRCQKDISL